MNELRRHARWKQYKRQHSAAAAAAGGGLFTVDQLTERR